MSLIPSPVVSPCSSLVGLPWHPTSAAGQTHPTELRTRRNVLPLLLSHLTGSLNSRHAACAFLEAGWLAECHHTLAWNAPPWLTRLLPSGLRAVCQRRAFSELPAAKLNAHPWPELARLAFRNLNLPWLGPHLRNRYRIEAVNRRFDSAVAYRVAHSSGLSGVYSYFDTSLHTFREARRIGLRTFYELPTPYWRLVERILASEHRRFQNSAWAATLPSCETIAEAGIHRDEELQLADIVIVPSPFVRDSLALAPSFKGEIIVVPYGCPEPTHEKSPHQSQEPLKLLFVGTLSQSKGLADLLEAVLPLGDQVKLTLAGSFPSLGASNLKSQISERPIRQLGQIPHHTLMAELRHHDLLILPTLYEGLSLAVLEAMSQGLPVLTTTHSGFQGIVEGGKQMLLIPPGDPNSLRMSLQELLNHRESLFRLAAAGLEWARGNTWSVYRQKLRTALAPFQPQA